MNNKAYFSKLNYTLANEDSSLEYQMVKELKPERVLSVCGSGGRALPLAAHTRKDLVCCDMAEEQLLLGKHRMATYSLDFRDFLMYWGFAPFSTTENRGIRQEIFSQLTLDEKTRAYFDDLYHQIEYEGILYHGSWEKTFTGVPLTLKRLIGGSYDKIFNFTDLEEQKRYFDKALEDSLWLAVPRMVLKAFGNAAFFNAFLYKGNFAKKNIPESHYEIYRKAYRRLFYQGLTRENFFLQLSFLGRIAYPEANPVEAKEEFFPEIVLGLKQCHVTFEKKDIIDCAVEATEGFNFVSFSDVPSYLSGISERDYLQRLKNGLRHNALVVVRCYLRIPENTDLSGYEDVTEKYQNLIDAEQTQVYRIFVYQFRGNL
ncbi:MAG: DUF3419 family protein [Oligoflexales bacterium]